VGSGSRDVDDWRTNGLYTEDRRLQVPMTLEGHTAVGARYDRVCEVEESPRDPTLVEQISWCKTVLVPRINQGDLLVIRPICCNIIIGDSGSRQEGRRDCGPTLITTMSSGQSVTEYELDTSGLQLMFHYKNSGKIDGKSR
jgi:hypothetical protein